MRAGAAALLAFGAMIVVSAEFIVIGLAPAMTADLSLAPAQSGWLVTLFALSSALLGPALVAGTSSMRPAPVLAATLIPFAATVLLIPFPSFAVTAVLRVLQGATLPLFIGLASAQLALAHGTGRGVALLYIGVTVGGTLAPPLGTFAGDRFGWVPPMAAIGVLALCILPVCLMLGTDKPTDDAGASWRLLKSGRLPSHLLLSVLLFAAMFTGFSYVALLLERAGFDADAVTIALLGFGLAGLIGNWIAGALTSAVFPATYGVALTIAVATTWLATAPEPSTVTVVLAMLAWGLAHAAGFVLCQVRVMAAAPEAPGFAAALNISAANIGIAIGSFVGGRAIELGGSFALGPATLVLAVFAVGVARWTAGADLRPREREAPVA